MGCSYDSKGMGQWLSRQLISDASSGGTNDKLYFRTGEDGSWGSLRSVLTDDGNGTTTVTNDLIVEDKSVIGWHGHDNFITVTPKEVGPSTHTGHWETKNNGGYMRIYDGTDGFYTATAPVGYKITGYSFSFSNVPDEIVAYSCNTGATGYTELSSKSTYTTISSTHKIFTDFFTFEHSSSDYISIRFINDSNNAFEFLGGVINIQRCSTGCGLQNILKDV